MKCESDGCRQVAEFYDPMGNRLCSDCIQMDVETAEYSWDDCESLEFLPEGVEDGQLTIVDSSGRISEGK